MSEGLAEDSPRQTDSETSTVKMLLCLFPIVFVLSAGQSGVTSSGVGGGAAQIGMGGTLLVVVRAPRRGLPLHLPVLGLRGGNGEDGEPGSHQGPPNMANGGGGDRDRDRLMRDSDPGSNRRSGYAHGDGGYAQSENVRGDVGPEAPRSLAEGVGEPCTTWRDYRPNTDAEQRRETKLAGILCPSLSFPWPQFRVFRVIALFFDLINPLRLQRIICASACWVWEHTPCTCRGDLMPSCTLVDGRSFRLKVAEGR